MLLGVPLTASKIKDGNLIRFEKGRGERGEREGKSFYLFFIFFLLFFIYLFIFSLDLFMK